MTKMCDGAASIQECPHPHNCILNCQFNDAELPKSEQLPQRTEQEPVAWMHVQGNYEEPSFRQLGDDEVERGWEQYPLYTHPPQRTWVDLTDEELEILFFESKDAVELCEAIQAKHKEKNT